MGTWDIGFFDNDMACDWENSLKDNKELCKIKEPLERVIYDSEESLDIDIANKALAAADALARLALKDGEKSTYTKHIDLWVEEFNEEIPKELISLAKESIKKILSPNSELKQFWTLRGEIETWQKNLNELDRRLSLV